MSVINQNLLLTPEGYQISRSVRLRSSASAYFNRTPASTSNRTTWTWSAWVKRGALGGTTVLLGSSGANYDEFRIDGDKFRYFINGAVTADLMTSAVYRDPSAWYHIILALDTTQAASSNRIKIYVNGVQVTAFSTSTYPAQNTNGTINSNISHSIGYSISNASLYLDGYLTDVNFIDGQALTPSSFGETDAVTGVWKPKKYAGTYGTNGFYLNFADNSAATAAAIGKDSSGNGNNWTPNNISMLTGTTVTSFTSVGTTTWTAPAGVSTVNYLVVAGGGGGGGCTAGARGASGGGAGGLLTGSLSVTGGSSYTVTVGAGGSAGTGSGNGGSGGSSVFSSVSTVGGAGGRGTSGAGGAGLSGGSGSGGIGSNGGGAGTSGQGNAGGSGNGNSPYYSGGGGGAGGAGASGASGGGGGAGLSVYTGTSSAVYAAGGAGGAGGGAGASGAANTGNGGGGAWNPNSGGAGGSGIVIVWYGSADTYDSMLDTPTPYADGGNGRGNYAVMNPLSSNSSMTIAGGNLNVTSSVGSQSFNAYSSIAVLTGKWYAEVTINTGSDADMIGVCPSTLYSGSARFDQSTGAVGYYTDGRKFVPAGGSAYGASYTTGAVIGIALDMDAQTVTFYKNGTSQGTISSSLTAGASYYFAVGDASASTGINQSWNFGQRPFAYTPPTGFKALNTQNLPDATIKKGNAYFDVVARAGATAPTSVTSLAFQPDLLWTKTRSAVTNHNLFDSARGLSVRLQSDNTGADAAAGSMVTSFNSNGYTFGSDYSGTNLSGSTHVDWVWKESASAGFDIVTYTGNGSAGNTFNHSLGVAPSMFIIKGRSGGSAATDYWYVYHKSLGNTYRVYLNTTGSSSTSANVCYPSGTSQVYLATGDSFFNASSENYVAYLFAEVAGYSKFGSYTGNGSADGPFVYLGFRPKWIMTKRTDSTGNWLVIDSSRNTYNVVNGYLLPNASDAEGTATWGDFTSNGFKLRGTTHNGSGETYIYAAFAENPFKNSLAR